jgi:ribonuclease E
MADKMLIDATHPEETRVVVLRGNRVEEFDFESANRKQLRGNIYLAKVTRVEPSLQAAFVDYGGNRHGFLAFSEIHPDYYQIPVADRQALLAEEARAQRDADDEADSRARGRGRRHRGRGANRRRDVMRSGPSPTEELADEEDGQQPAGELPSEHRGKPSDAEPSASEPAASETMQEAIERPPAEAAPGGDSIAIAAADEAGRAPETREQDAAEAARGGEEDSAEENGDTEPSDAAGDETGEETEARTASPGDSDGGEEQAEEEAVESVGGADALEEVQERLPRFRRQYKIQEVIKRRQVMLVQVVKEERGTKGAALTTYLSLAGRYSVLMPNTARGGGISRKITSAEDRSRLKEIAQELEVPEGMGVILRTAGASRTKTEVKRDFEYLLRLWETVRDLTLKSTAPTLVYEEGSLIKRSIRDLYSKDIDEIAVSGDDGYKEARDFMRMLMPSHVKNVKQYKDSQPILTRYGIESQLDAMFSPVVQLRSGGYIVINQAEALVAIDVNSGRATREHHIEDTALKTNIEAAEEIARQLRLRDLAGLIVIDFIDMDEGRNNRQVERRLKEALKHDRARIQVGRISHFGLLEMSRQRIRTSVLESSTDKCPVCGGSGHVRSVSSVALQCLRALEEMLIKGATHNLVVRTRAEVALYMLNHKRVHLRELEERFRITITVQVDPAVAGQQSYIVDRGEQVHSAEAARSLAQAAAAVGTVAEEDTGVEEAEAQDEDTAARGEDREGGRRRRRRRGRGRGRGEARDESEAAHEFTHETAAEHAVAHEDHDGGVPEEDEDAAHADAGDGDGGEPRDGSRRRRRRGRRGGRRNRRGREGERPDAAFSAGDEEASPGASYGPAERPEAAFGGGESERENVPYSGSEGAPEPDLQHAVEDLDLPAAARNGDDSSGSAAAPAFAPPPAEKRPAPPAEAAEPGPATRRGSTIREPVPFSGAGEPAPSSTLPPPKPVISSTANAQPLEPRRGWWGKRLLGDKD